MGYEQCCVQTSLILPEADIQQISYIIFELPSNMLLKYFTPHVWQGRIFFIWGLVTLCSGLVKTSGQLLACRFLVGYEITFLLTI
jgi:hypothetical protein